MLYADKMPREATWRTMSQYAFCASPHGHGLDCHRTWEALALGCIPIVKSSALDDLYAQFPVWIVNDWSEVTLGAMRARIATMSECSLDSLRLERWTMEILASSRAASA